MLRVLDDSLVKLPCYMLTLGVGFWSTPYTIIPNLSFSSFFNSLNLFSSSMSVGLVTSDITSYRWDTALRSPGVTCMFEVSFSSVSSLLTLASLFLLDVVALSLILLYTYMCESFL